MKHRFQLVLPRELWESLKALSRRNRRPISEEARIAIEDHLEETEAAQRAQASYEAWKADPSLGKPYRQVREELDESDEAGS